MCSVSFTPNLCPCFIFPSFSCFLLQKLTLNIFVCLELTLNPPEGILAGEHLQLNKTNRHFQSWQPLSKPCQSFC